MDTSDGPQGLGLGLIPGFRQPAHRRMDPPLPEVPADPETAADPAGPGPAMPAAADPEPGRPSGFLDRLSHRRDPSGPDSRTGTSSTGRPATPEQTAAAIAGLLGLALLGVAGLVRLLARPRGRRTLRKPTEEQLDDVAAPLARIVLRHAPSGLLSQDLMDGAAAGAAFATYATDGRLIVPVDVDPGVPVDLATTDDPEGVPA